MIKELKREMAKMFKALKFEGELIYNPDELNISERVVGGKVELINQDGTLSVLPDGDYELSDGFKFTVKEGLISAIEGEDPVEETEQPEEMAEDAPVEEAPKEDGLAELKAETEAIKAEVEALKQALAELMEASAGNAKKEDVENFSSEVTKLTDTIMKLAKIPAAPTKTNQSNVVKDSTDTKMMEFVKMFHSINKN